jgi:hypothetical protein
MALLIQFLKAVNYEWNSNCGHDWFLPRWRVSWWPCIWKVKTQSAGNCMSKLMEMSFWLSNGWRMLTNGRDCTVRYPYSYVNRHEAKRVCEDFWRVVTNLEVRIPVVWILLFKGESETTKFPAV